MRDSEKTMRKLHQDMQNLIDEGKLPDTILAPVSLKDVMETYLPCILLIIIWCVCAIAVLSGLRFPPLFLICFLSGSLSGIEGSFLSGILARFSLLLCLNSLARKFMVENLTLGEYLEILRQKASRQKHALTHSLMPGDRGVRLFGAAFGWLLVPLLTGGYFVNAMAVFLLALTLMLQASGEDGFSVRAARALCPQAEASSIEAFFYSMAGGLSAVFLLFIQWLPGHELLYPLMMYGVPCILFLFGRAQRKKGKAL